MSPPLKNTFQEVGILVLDVLQQFIGQLGVGAGKERVTGCREGEDVLRPAGATTGGVMFEQAVMFQGAEMLPGTTERDRQLARL